MYINPKELIAGYPSLRVRDLFKKWVYCHFSLPFVAKKMMINQKAAKTFIKALIQLELITKVKKRRGKLEQFWMITEKGNRLALATASRIKRNTAERCVKKLLEKIEEINSDPTYMHRVEGVIVFGGYLTESPFLSDIDLCIIVGDRNVPFTQIDTSKIYDPTSIKDLPEKDNTYTLESYCKKESLLWDLKIHKALEFHGFMDILLCIKDYKFLFLDERLDENKIRQRIEENSVTMLERKKNNEFAYYI